MEAQAVQPQPDPPERPDGTDPAPVWPAWYSIVAFLAAVAGTLVVGGMLAAAMGVEPDEESVGFTILATLVQDAFLVGAALLFASFVLPPRPWHFGLQRTRFWPAVGWAALGLFSFYVFAAAFAAAVQPDVEQQVTENLGADEGALGLIVAGVMVMVVAPAAEELFFRGFFYRALRSRFPVLGAAAIDGVLFGLIHFDFSGSDALLLVPPLGVLGFLFCLVYERTGSLYPVIAMHAFNNAIAYGVQAEAWEVSAVLGPLMIAACMLVPRLGRSAPRPAPALR
jgi:membrane protease YdiL (CAAX protease family)